MQLASFIIYKSKKRTDLNISLFRYTFLSYLHEGYEKNSKKVTCGSQRQSRQRVFRIHDLPLWDR